MSIMGRFLEELVHLIKVSRKLSVVILNLVMAITNNDSQVTDSSSQVTVSSPMLLLSKLQAPTQ